MADVVFEDESNLRRPTKKVNASESAVVNVLLNRGIAKTKEQANAYVITLLIFVILAMFFFFDRAGITSTGIGNIGQPEREEPILNPAQMEMLYGEQ